MRTKYVMNDATSWPREPLLDARPPTTRLDTTQEAPPVRNNEDRRWEEFLKFRDTVTEMGGQSVALSAVTRETFDRNPARAWNEALRLFDVRHAARDRKIEDLRSLRHELELFGHGSDGFSLANYLTVLDGRDANFFEGAPRNEEHERLQDVAKRPWCKRLLEQTQRETRGRTFPIPLAALDRSARWTLAETYTADAATRRRPRYMSDMTMDFSRARPIADMLGVPVIVTRDDVSIPVYRASGGIAVETLAETTEAADAGSTVTLITSSPKRVAARNDVSTSLLVGAQPSREMLIADLYRAVEYGMESGYWKGAGGNAVTGISQVSGIGSVTVSGSSPTYSEILQLAEYIEDRNINVPIVYATSAKGLRVVRDVARARGDDRMFTVRYTDEGRRTYLDDGSYEAASSQHLPDNLGGGSNETLLVAAAPAATWRVRYAMAFLTVDDVSRMSGGVTRFSLNVYHDVLPLTPSAIATMQWTA